MFVRSVDRKDRNGPDDRLTTKLPLPRWFVYFYGQKTSSIWLLGSIPFLSCKGSLDKTDCDAKL